MKNLKRFLSIVVLVFISSSVFAQLAKTTVTITPLPIAKAVTGSTVCANQNGTITITGAESGVLYQAYTGGFGGTLVGSGTPGANGDYTITVDKLNLSQPVDENTVATTISVKGTRNPGGCAVNMTNTADINVVPLPLTRTLTGSNVAPATDGTVTITATETGVVYQAFIGATAVGTPVTGDGTDLAVTIPKANLVAGANNVTVVATRAGLCPTTIGPITVNVKPTAEITGVLCNNQSGTIQLALTGVGPWHVVLSNGQIVDVLAGTASPVNVTVAPVVALPATLSVSSVTGNSIAGDVVGSAITLFPTPEVTMTPTMVLCEGTTATSIEVTLTKGGFAANVNAGWTLTWDKYVGGSVVEGPTPSVLSLTNKITITGTTTVDGTEYRVTKVVDSNGCIAQ